jgi:hypothetical protein
MNLALVTWDPRRLGHSILLRFITPHNHKGKREIRFLLQCSAHKQKSSMKKEVIAEAKRVQKFPADPEGPTGVGQE